MAQLAANEDRRGGEGCAAPEAELGQPSRRFSAPTKPASKPKVVPRSSVLPAKALRSEEEIDEYLAQLKTRLLEEASKASTASAWDKGDKLWQP